jgi:hypothetical protein
MDTTLSSSAPSQSGSPLASQGFTLIETAIAMSIFTFVILAFVTTFIFGLKTDQLVQSKLGASDESRRSFEKVARDIRCANSQAIGSYSPGTFTPNVNGSNEIGNAIRIYLNATNNNNIIYYYDTSGGPGFWKLCRMHTGDSGPTTIATHLQNSCTFTAEDFAGNVQQNMQDKQVIHFSLDFKEYQYPLTKVGTNLYYDRYVLDFRATPHVPGGK